MISPPLLKPGNKAIIIAPSGKVPEQGIDRAVDVLQQWGLGVSLGKHVFASTGVFAGTDAERQSDFQKALDDPEIRLILCARGGYGLTRYVDKLNFKALKQNPKWIVGFSDITALQLVLAKNKIHAIHGPMATSFDRSGTEKSIQSLYELLFKGYSNIESKQQQLRKGEVQGNVIGGNLSLICESLGTSSEIDTQGKILVLEDVGEYYYRIDRMLNQLARAGKLSHLKGLVIGSFNDLLHGHTAFSESVEDMIIRLTSHWEYPIAVGMPLGHQPENYPFIQEAEYRLIVADDYALLQLSGV